MRAYTRTTSSLSTSARDRFIADHVGMAKRIALRVARKVPAWIDSADLVSAAMVGLAESADRYDSTRAEPFVAFAERRIRGAVLDELRRGDILPRRVRHSARKVGRCIRTLEGTLGRAPEDQEIAEALEVSVDEYLGQLAILGHISFVELGSGEEGAAGRIQADDESPAAHAERRQEKALLARSIEKLPERDAQILSLYYVDEFTLAEIGALIGVSESRVSQLHTRALVRLRAEVDEAPSLRESA